MLENYPDLLTTENVMELLQVSKITLIRWAKSGKLVPEIRLNQRGDKRYTKKQMLQFIGEDADDFTLFADYPPLLTSQNVMDMLQISKITLIRWDQTGKLSPELRLNDRGDKRYTKRQVLAFLGISA